MGQPVSPHHVLPIMDGGNESVDGDDAAQAPLNPLAAMVESLVAQVPDSTAVSAFHPESDAERKIRKWFRLEGSEVEMMSVADEEVNSELSKLGAIPLNFLMICGPARKGKSFLMNMLAGLESHSTLFPVSGQNVACTSGVDISPSIVPLSRVTSTAASPVSFAALSSEVHVRSRPLLRRRIYHPHANN